ncbi:gamma-tubulin complex component 3 [Cylas formicarius]|uniref:gamma-tubulin complex component 3 n=1 Tax=Cylas formicarius TaxID=197179 RepID=UPI0029586521|nr:gamma-tubulin complex component 3 [Cylas formicarius]
MNNAGINERTNVSDLITKLCKHLAQNDEVLAAKLNDKAIRLLNESSSITSHTPSDEPYYIDQIRRLLGSQSKDKVEKFELIYATISKSNVIKQRTSILSFIFKISAQNDGSLFSLGNKLEQFSSQNLPTSRTSSKICVNKPIFHEGNNVRHIFDGKKFNSSVSTLIRPNSQSTAISSVAAWSRNDVGSSSKGSLYNAVSEQDLLQDAIYSLQGIDGMYIRKEPGGCGFTLDPKATKILSPIQRSLLDRLVGMSFLHMQLKQYCEDIEKQSGTIFQALNATLRHELSDYYKMVALLQANMNGCLEHELTLRRALFVVQDHRIRFEWLAYIAEQCRDKKGGELITAIHGFLQHGSKCAQEVSERVLKAVCKPLYIMLSRWLLDGEINDPCNEFFIEAKHAISAERLWHEKYNVRKAMVPSFINMEQALRILATGKSINFLRQICKDGGQLPGSEALQKLFKTTSAEALFKPEESIEFHSTLESVYKETSLRVLDLLKNKFNLYDHLQSLRRYLLLGQGDFIRYLLELLAPELNKPAGEIYGHTLSTILETAIRVTNAQYEHEDTLQRLNVSFMSHSIGDTGWDVFSLIYIVDGPIGTIFQPTMPTYQCLFGALWKAKRTEYILANMRRQQLSMAKLFRRIKELAPVMHIIHILTCKMIHFIHQTQYYFLFEVLECAWTEMQNRVNRAECLDDIILGHTNFLNFVQRGVLLDERSRPLFSHLISIYNFVVNLEAHQDSLYSAAAREYEAYIEYRQLAESVDQFQVTADVEKAAKVRRATFHQFLNSTRLKVKSTAQTYDVIVTKFLELLTSSTDLKLQLLSVRLSFNDFYKVA